MTQPTQPPDLPPTQSSAASSPPANRAGQDAAAKPWRLDAATGTHPGKARDHNEDAVRGTPLDFPAAVQRGFLFIVADGMGGHNAGEIASSESVARVYQRYYEDSDPDIHRSLENAMRRTSAELFNQAQTYPQQHGMGTTFTAAVIKDTRASVAHVGDSRLYLIRNGQPEQLTQDHSWVEEQVRAGVLTRVQAETHPQRNVITRALATMPDVKVEHYERELQPGDALVLCSDGLNTEVGDAQIAALAIKAVSAEEAVMRLIQLANDNGGEDNVSVIVIRLSDGAAAAPATATNTTGRKSLILPVILGVAGLVLLAALAAVLLGQRPVQESGGAQAAKTATPAAPVAVPSVTLAVTPIPTSAELRNGSTPSSAAEAAAPTVTLAPIKPSETPLPTRVVSKTATAQPTTPIITANVVAVPPSLVAPVDGVTAGGDVTFQWQPGGPLPVGARYEIVMWNKNDEPDTAKGIAAPTDEVSLTVNIDNVCENQKTGPEVRWTVLVVNPGTNQGYQWLTTPSQSTQYRLICQPPG